MSESKDNNNGVTSTTTSTTVVTTTSPPPVTQVASQVNTVTPIRTSLPQVQVIHQPVTMSNYIQQIYSQQLMVQAAMQASGINPQQISLAAVQGRAATVSQGITPKSPSLIQPVQPTTSQAGPVKLTSSTGHVSSQSPIVTATSTTMTKPTFITTGAPLQHTATPMVAGKPFHQRPLVIGQLGVLSTPQSTIGQAQNQNNKGIGTSTPTTQTCGATILAAPQITLSSQGQLVTNTGQILTTQPSQGSVITSPTMSQAVLSHLQAMATLQHNLPLAQTFTQSPNILPNQPLYIRATMPIHQAQAQALVGSLQAVTTATGGKAKQTVELPATLQVRPAVAVPHGKQNAGSQTSKSMANMVNRVKGRALPKVNPILPTTVGKVIAKPVQQLTPIAPTPIVQQVKVEPMQTDDPPPVARVTATVTPEAQCTSTVTTTNQTTAATDPVCTAVRDQVIGVNGSANGHCEAVNTNGDIKEEEEEMDVDKKVDLSTVTTNGKQRAIVKPQVLTHIIEGFVIQEGPDPFPVQRSALLNVNNLHKPPHPRSKSDDDARQTEEASSDGGMKDLDMESDSQTESLNNKDDFGLGSSAQLSVAHHAGLDLVRQNWDWKSYYSNAGLSHLVDSDTPATLKCEFCGKVDLASKFRRSKRFCSMACAKRYNVGCSRRLGLFKPKPQNPDACTPGTSSGKVHKKKKHSLKKKAMRRGFPGHLNTSPLSQKNADENADQSQPPSETSQESTETGHDSQDFHMQWQYINKHGSGQRKPMHRDQVDTEDQTSTSAPSSSGVDEDNTSLSEPMPSPPLLVPEAVPGPLNANPARWTVEEVYEFIQSMQGCAPYADVFRSQEIDGQALLLLKEDHLMSAMNMKLGPALKICARINSLKEERS